MARRDSLTAPAPVHLRSRRPSFVEVLMKGGGGVGGGDGGGAENENTEKDDDEPEVIDSGGSRVGGHLVEDESSKLRKLHLQQRSEMCLQLPSRQTSILIQPQKQKCQLKPMKPRNSESSINFCRVSKGQQPHQQQHPVWSNQHLYSVDPDGITRFNSTATSLQSGGSLGGSRVSISKHDFPIGTRNSRRFSLAQSHQRKMMEVQWRGSIDSTKSGSDRRNSSTVVIPGPANVIVPSLGDHPNTSTLIPRIVEHSSAGGKRRVSKTPQCSEVIYESKCKDGDDSGEDVTEVPSGGKLWGRFEFITTDPNNPHKIFSPGLLHLELLNKPGYQMKKPSFVKLEGGGGGLLDEDEEEMSKSSQDICFNLILCSGAAVILLSVSISLGLFLYRFIGHFDTDEGQKNA